MNIFGKPSQQAISLIDIDLIKVDVKQPRKYFDPISIQDLANSILIEGLINPIEIDKHNILLTGEKRFRAAKLTGIKKIKAHVVDIDPLYRLRRQLIENIHHNTMTQMETSNGIDRLCQQIKNNPKEFGVNKNVKIKDFTRNNSLDNFEKTCKYPFWVIKTVADNLGKDIRWVYFQLSFLNESKEVQEYLNTTKGKFTLIQLITRSRKINEDIKNKLKQKVIKKELVDFDTTIELIRTIQRIPEKIDELLENKYDNPKSMQNLLKIHRIAPEEITTIESISTGIGVVKNMQTLLLSLKKLELEKVLPYDKAQLHKLSQILVRELTSSQLALPEKTH